MAIKIPTMIFFFLVKVFMQLAAWAAINLSKSRLNQKKSHSSEGIVKVICCHEVLGNSWFCFCIHSSVAFLPQDEQALHLQVKWIYLMCGQVGFWQWYSLYPRILFLQLSNLIMQVTIPALRLALCFSKKFHQLWLERRICLMVYFAAIGLLAKFERAATGATAHRREGVVG